MSENPGGAALGVLAARRAADAVVAQRSMLGCDFAGRRCGPSIAICAVPVGAEVRRGAVSSAFIAIVAVSSLGAIGGRGGGIGFVVLTAATAGPAFSFDPAIAAVRAGAGR